MSSRASKRRKLERERLSCCDQVITLDVSPLGTFIVDTKYFEPPPEEVFRSPDFVPSKNIFTTGRQGSSTARNAILNLVRRTLRRNDALYAKQLARTFIINDNSPEYVALMSDIDAALEKP